MHFCLLSAQLWGVLMAIDIYLNISSINVARGPRNKTKLIKYCLIAFVSSIVIVIVTITFSKLRIIEMSYENEGICALHGFYGRIIFYFIPLALSFLVSVFFLSASIRHVSRENKRNQQALGESRSRGVSVHVIALKLIIIGALPEGIGFIYIQKTSLTEELIVNLFFSMLYSCVKGFRGVLLFIVYICRKHVLDMYRKTTWLK